MSKNTKWVLLFGLLVLTYAAGQYLEQQKEKTFKSPLLDFLPGQITVIKIHKQGKTPFQLLRLENKWFLSANNVHEQAIDTTVEQLLRLLKMIRTTEITSQQETDWKQYEVTDEQGVLICMETNEKELPCIRFGAIHFSAKENSLKAFARLDTQKEVYALNGFSVSSLKCNYNDYRNGQILRIDDPLIKLKFTKDTTVLSISKWNGQWVDDELKLLDSLVWENMIPTLTNLSLNTFIDDLDEWMLAGKKRRSLQLFTARDSFRLDFFTDSTYSLPFILHSDQFPKTWMACDSAQFLALFPEKEFQNMTKHARSSLHIPANE